MPFLSKSDIDPDIRALYEGRYKSQLKGALLNPGLTASQRQHLRMQIRTIGLPKLYTAESSPKPGAISLPNA